MYNFSIRYELPIIVVGKYNNINQTMIIEQRLALGDFKEAQEIINRIKESLK